MGARQSLGLFLQPISDSLGTGRETFSLAIAVQNILFGLPFAGMLADKIGPRWVVVSGAIIYAAGFGILSIASSVLNLFVGMGVLVGLALSATSYVVVLGAVGRAVPAERRSTAFGIGTAAGSLGTFAVVPGMQWLITALGWETALWYAAIAVGFIGVFALGYPSGHGESREVDDEVEEHLGTVLRNACTHSGYILLNIGFFVCGFHVSFIATHLPAYLADFGLPNMIAATALSLIGLFNMFGSYLFGRWGDYYRKKYLLSFLYGVCALIIACFLIVPVTNVTAIIFACLIGFVWLATVPLTSVGRLHKYLDHVTCLHCMALFFSTTKSQVSLGCGSMEGSTMHPAPTPLCGSVPSSLGSWRLFYTSRSRMKLFTRRRSYSLSNRYLR